jgi:2-polyprenyl-6-methoxyphenol hydroxylase-like FAD-dependent oxidoreductase
MSPVGGVGINLAIQDAVAAANILAAAMARGESPDPLLAKVQDRRMFPVKVIQTLQRAIHKRVLGSALASRDPRAPWQLKLVDAVPLLQRVPARLLGLGVKREHIRSPSI